MKTRKKSIENFLGRFERAEERLFVLDTHSDAIGIEYATDHVHFMSEEEIYLYPPSLMTNSFAGVYPVSTSETIKGSTEDGLHKREIVRIPHILHYGSSQHDSLYWKELCNTNELEYCVERIKCPVDFHIDPDVLNPEAEMEIAKMYAGESGLPLEKELGKFEKDPKNPFYHGFGIVTADDLLSIMKLDMEKLYIAEAFHFLEDLKPYHIEVGKAIIGYLASNFLNRAPSKIKAYVLDCRIGKRYKGSFFKHAKDAVSNLKNVREVVCTDIKKISLDERASLRDEILKQSHPLLVSSTHAGAGYVMRDVVLRRKLPLI